MARGGSKKAAAAATAPPGPIKPSASSRAPAATADQLLPPSPTVTVVPPASPAPLASSIPAVFQFPLLLVLSLAFSALLKTVFHYANGPSQRYVSRDGDDEWRLATTTAWKAIELATVWFCGFDAQDIFAFSLLTRIPHTYLLTTFYLVPRWPTTVLTLLSSYSDYLAVSLLRPMSAYHLALPKADERVASDPTIRILVLLLGTAAYSIPLLISFATWLPTHLAAYFSGIATLDPAHSLSLPLVALPLLPMGWPALKYAFEPAAHSLSAAAPTEYTFPPEFDPITATLSQTLHRNILWHLYLPARTQELFKRTMALMICTLGNAALMPWLEIDGCDLYGAVGWAAIWGVGAGVSGLSLGWVAGVLN